MKPTPLLKVLFCLLAASCISSASPIPDFPFIAADGRSEREVPPTNAKVTFTVLAFSKSSEEATSTVQSALGRVITTLKGLGVREDQIRANDLQKSATRDRNKEMYKETDILGYEVSRTVEMRLPELTNYPKIVRALMAADNITKVDSTFDTSKREEVEAELVGEACAKARKKADLLAKGAGVAISGIHAVSDHDFSNVGGNFGFGFGRSDADSYGAPGLLPAEIAEVPLFVPTTIELSAAVSVLYKLAQ